MKLEELQSILETKKRGTYLTLTYHKEYVYKRRNETYGKTTTTTIRLVDKRSKENRGKSSNPNNVELGNNIVYNKNTGKTHLVVFLTNCKWHTPKSYYTKLNANGESEEISKEEFNANVRRNPLQGEYFYLDIESIISIK